jgi:hypothetical protein
MSHRPTDGTSRCSRKAAPNDFRLYVEFDRLLTESVRSIDELTPYNVPVMRFGH